MAALLFAASSAMAAPLPDQIRAVAAATGAASRNAALLYDEREWLERFYAPRAYAPAWTGNGKVSAAHAMELLQTAPEHGLDLADYAGEPLLRDADAARRDAGLTLAMLRLLADLHAGRARTGIQPPVPDVRVRDFDPVAELRSALAENKLDAALDAAAPQLAMYGRLKTALVQMRALAAQPFPPLAPLPEGRKSVKPGESYEGARGVAERLILLGDMAPEQAVKQGEDYSAVLSAAVKHFQLRHGLEADGNLGRQTWQALSLPLSARVRQMELSMERLRWLPDLSGGPVIAINVPSFQLWAFETGSAAMAPSLQMRVIVGKAVGTPTPVFLATMRYLEFNPYWNVPRSIERNEVIPKLTKEVDYLEKNNMELVDSRGVVSEAVGAAALAALRAGGMRVRQRPGASNSLGAIKFGLPNDMDIYLHSTPSRNLFQRARRDFSHGCIRVEDPGALAQFVLAGQSDWDTKSIAAAMEVGPTKTVRLARTVPVIVFYTTAIVGKDGRTVFADDLYGLDTALERALASRSAARN